MKKHCFSKFSVVLCIGMFVLLLGGYPSLSGAKGKYTPDPEVLEEFGVLQSYIVELSPKELKKPL